MARQADGRVGCQRDQIWAGRGVRWAGIEVRRAAEGQVGRQKSSREVDSQVDSQSIR